MTELDPRRLPRSAGDLISEPLASVALARLIEEVRHAGDGATVDLTAYNRTYHRHNR